MIKAIGALMATKLLVPLSCYLCVVLHVTGNS